MYKELPGKETLNGHIPIELSRIVAGFLGASEMMHQSVQVCCKRKREVGLIVPGMYRARTKRRKHAKVLSEELQKIAERYPYFEFEIKQNLPSKPVLVKQTTNQKRGICLKKDFLNNFPYEGISPKPTTN